MRSRSLAALVLFLPTAAHASLFGEENAALGQIAATVGAELATVGETLHEAVGYYRDFREYAGYTKDAFDAFNAARTGNITLMSAAEFLDDAFPEVGRVRREIQHGDWWTADNGLRRLARLCLTESIQVGGRHTRCMEFESKATAADVRAKLEVAFGPVSLQRTQAARDTAAVAIATAQNYEGRAAMTRQLVTPQLNDTCANAKDIAACQTAAALAQIKALDQLADVNDQLAEANRLVAVQIEQENARVEAEIEALRRQQQITLDAAIQASKPLRVVIDL